MAATNFQSSEVPEFPLFRRSRAAMDSFTLLGDSLFQHAFARGRDREGHTIGSFGPRLSEAYIRRLDVLDRGFSGYNTRQVLSLLNSDRHALPKHNEQNMRFLVLFLGANDSRLPNTPGGPQQHVPLKEFGENLGKIVAKVKGHAAPKNIILVTPPPVDERMTVEGDSAKSAELQGVVRRKAVVTAEYARIVRELAAERGIALVDIWDVVMRKAGWQPSSTASKDGGNELETEYVDEYAKTITESKAAPGYDEHTLPGSSAAPVNEVLQSFLHDGLHFTRKGYDLLFDELMKVIANNFPDQVPEKLPFVMPAWDDEGAWNVRGQLISSDQADITRRLEKAETKGAMGGIALTLVLLAFFWLLGIVNFGFRA